MVFVSASPPMNPMRVILLGYIVFLPVLPVCSGALRSERPPLPRQGVAFLGGPEWGSQNRNGVVRRSRGFEDRRAREWARSCALNRRADQEMTVPQGSTHPTAHPVSASSRRIYRNAEEQVRAEEFPHRL